MENPANTQYDIHEITKKRWSPRAFANKMVEKEKVCQIFEAARWAPSAFNEQPWRFLLGIKGEETYEMIRKTLVEFNQVWTEKAPILILNIAAKTFAHNGKPNSTYAYDLGQAVSQMVHEAGCKGLYAHQMSGFDPEKARVLFKIPEQFEALSVTAIGYIGDPNDLPEDMAKMELRDRERNHFNDFVFQDEFGSKNKIFHKI